MKSILVAGLPFVILPILLPHIRFVNALKLPFKYHPRKLIVCCHTSREIPFEVRFNMYLRNQSLPMPMPISYAETMYAKFELIRFQAQEAFERQVALAELKRKAKERSDTKWTRVVIACALILGCSTLGISISIYYGAVNFGAAVITPKFKEQFIKAISEIRIFRFG